MTTSNKNMAKYYADRLADEVLHVLNLINIIDGANIISQDTKESIINRTKSNLNHLNIILQS